MEHLLTAIDWAKYSLYVVVAAGLVAAWFLNKKWGGAGRVHAEWAVQPTFRLDRQETPRKSWIWKLVFKTWLRKVFNENKRVLRLVVTNQAKLVMKTNDRRIAEKEVITITIPKGFDCDGASIPPFARVWLDRLWLIETGAGHDALYAQQISRKLADEAFYSLARQAHGRLAARLAWIALRAAGWYPYWRAKRKMLRP